MNASPTIASLLLSAISPVVFKSTKESPFIRAFPPYPLSTIFPVYSSVIRDESSVPAINAFVSSLFAK